jgi:hypothetical protein
VLAAVAYGVIGYGFPAFRNACMILLCTALSGWGWHLLLPAPHGRRFSLSLVLIPYYGLAQIAMIGAIFIGFSLPMRAYPWVNFLVATGTVVCAARYRPRHLTRWLNDLTRHASRLGWLLVLGLLPLLLVLISPVLDSGISTSPYRIGPDLASYARMTNYLIEGGDWAHRLVNFPEYAQGESVVDISRRADASMTWPFLYWYRWGETAATYFFYVVTGSQHVFEVAYLTLLPSVLLLGGLVAVYLVSAFSFPVLLAALLGGAFLLNATLLNLWCEGFYGQLFAMPFIFVALMWFLQLRKAGPAAGLRDGATGIIAMLVVLLSYAEGLFFVVSVCFAVTVFLDACVYRVLLWRAYAIFLATWLAACIGVWPLGFLGEWWVLALRNIVEAGGNGYSQPVWAMLGEMIGVINPYSGITTFDAEIGIWRPAHVVLASAALTVLLLANIQFHSTQNRIAVAERSLLLAPYVLIVAMVLVYPWIAESNYGYMKIYSNLLPLIFLAACVAVRTGCESFSRARNAVSLLCLAALSASWAGGVDYLVTYNASRQTVSAAQMDLQRLSPLLAGQQALLLPAPKIYRSEQDVFMLGATVSTTWINPYAYSRFNNAYGRLDSTVLLLAGREEREHLPAAYTEVFRNSGYVVMDTHRRLADGLRYDRKKIGNWLSPKSYLIDADR